MRNHVLAVLLTLVILVCWADVDCEMLTEFTSDQEALEYLNENETPETHYIDK